MLILTPEQEEAVAKMAAEPTKAALNASVVGKGKTVMSVELAKRIGARTILVICPLGTMIGWERTFNMQEYGLPVRRINSTKSGKESMELFRSNTEGIYLIGREYFRRFDWLRLKTDMIIYDEVHGIQNRKSKSFQKIMQTKDIPGYKLALSATPFRNNFQGAWAVTRWLWPDKIERSFHRWAGSWCQVVYDPFTYNRTKVVGERYPGSFTNWLPCYVRLTYTDAELDRFFGKDPTAPDLVEPIYVDLSPAQRKQYEQMEADAVAWLQDNPLVAELPVTQRLRLRQMSLGTVTLGEDGEVLFDLDCKSSKIDAVKELLPTYGNEGFIVVESQRFAEVLAHRLDAALWSGKTKQAERDAILKNPPERLVATIASIGEGVDGLQHKYHLGVFVSEHEDNVLNQQVIGRILRTGQTKEVDWYSIIARNTWDEGIFLGLKTSAAEMRETLSGKK